MKKSQKASQQKIRGITKNSFERYNTKEMCKKQSKMIILPIFCKILLQNIEMQQILALSFQYILGFSSESFKQNLFMKRSE